MKLGNESLMMLYEAPESLTSMVLDPLAVILSDEKARPYKAERIAKDPAGLDWKCSQSRRRVRIVVLTHCHEHRRLPGSPLQQLNFMPIRVGRRHQRVFLCARPAF